MKNLDYHNVGLAIGDSNRMLRRGLKSALFTSGFRDIMDTDKVSAIRQAVEDNAVDLLICGTRLTDGDSLGLTHDIRHHRIGKNPFIVIITLVNNPGRETVMKVLSAGADDVVIKPISVGTLMERISHLARERKNFIVTTDYIGPNRRDGNRPDAMAIPEIDVPNPIKAKVRGEANVEELQRVIDKVAGVVNEQKMERHAHQIDYLVDRIVPLYEAETVDRKVVEMMERLILVTEDIGRRLGGTRYAHVAELCQSLVSVTENINKKPLSPHPQDIKLLPQLAQAIRRAFAPEDGAAMLARDITESVKKRVN